MNARPVAVHPGDHAATTRNVVQIKTAVEIAKTGQFITTLTALITPLIQTTGSPIVGDRVQTP
jgi:hypothetical protein